MGTEADVLRQLLSRPGLYLGTESYDTWFAFFTGYSLACSMRGVDPPLWDGILEQMRAEVAPEYAEGSLSLYQILERISGGDRKLALDTLKREIQKRFPDSASQSTVR